MISGPVSPSDRTLFNANVCHPLQSYEWGEFREETGVKVIRRLFSENGKTTGAFTLTIHPIPRTPWTIGYLPKGTFPTGELLSDLREIGKAENCLFIQLEPEVVKSHQTEEDIKQLPLRPSVRPLFTKYSFVLDITPPEEELLKNMHQKTRYNIRLAERKGVTIIEDNSDTAFETYWRLTEETTKRQHFYAHTKSYHQKQWTAFPHTKTDNSLSSHLFLAKFADKVLAAWILFMFQDVLYYPYGASSREHRELMASNLLMWEAIRFGKRNGLSMLDMWGALGPQPDTSDPWYGFHRFKEGYGATLTEYIGSYDLVLKPLLYKGFAFANSLRWLLLRSS